MLDHLSGWRRTLLLVRSSRMRPRTSSNDSALQADRPAQPPIAPADTETTTLPEVRSWSVRHSGLGERNIPFASMRRNSSFSSSTHYLNHRQPQDWVTGQFQIRVSTRAYASIHAHMHIHTLKTSVGSDRPHASLAASCNYACRPGAWDASFRKLHNAHQLYDPRCDDT